MSRILAFLIIMLISLTLGGVASGIYVAMIRNRTDEEKERNPISIAPVVTLIMVVSLLLGLVVFGIYYLATMPSEKTCPECKKCDECVLSEEDFRRLKRAENDIASFQEKANYVPDIKVKETCRGGETGIEGGNCTKYRFKTQPEPPAVSYISPKPTLGAHPPVRVERQPERPVGGMRKLPFDGSPIARKN